MLTFNWIYFDWDDLVASSAWIKKIVVCGVFVGVLFLIYWFDLRYRRRILIQQKQQTITLQEQMLQSQLQVKQFALHQAQSQMRREELHVLLQQLPKNSDIPGLVEYISHVGIANGLTFESIAMQPEEEHDFYMALPIDLVVKGDYQQFAKFIGEISNLPQLVTTHDFLIKRGGDLLDISLTVKTYIYKDQSIEDVQEINRNNEQVLVTHSRSPFTPDKIAELPASYKVLENLPLEKLRMVGSLKNKDKIIAILSTESHVFYPVAIGDYIGKNRGKIIAIDDNQMEVKEKFSDGHDGWKSLSILLNVQNSNAQRSLDGAQRHQSSDP